MGNELGEVRVTDRTSDLKLGREESQLRYTQYNSPWGHCIPDSRCEQLEAECGTSVLISGHWSRCGLTFGLSQGKRGKLDLNLALVSILQMLNESQGSVTPMHRGHTVKPNLTSELLNQAEINLRRAEIGSTFLHRLDCLRTKTIVEYKTNY